MQSFALEPDDGLVTTLQRAFKEVTGEELPVEYDPSVCDSNIFGGISGDTHRDLRPLRRRYARCKRVRPCLAGEKLCRGL